MDTPAIDLTAVTNKPAPWNQKGIPYGVRCARAAKAGRDPGPSPVEKQNADVRMNRRKAPQAADDE
ncbi:MAG: hypothetical protein GY929_08985 [Actinomycetia bacterium]|nr:hypothetical protein [Actinomycetes bacterium]